MLPAVLSQGAVNAVARIIPAVARTAPAAFATVRARIVGLGGRIGDTVDDVVNWVRANPGNAGVALITLASVGVSVKEAIDAHDDPVTLQKMVDQATNAATPLADLVRQMAAADVSASLKLNVSANSKDMATAANILGWAKRFFGSEQAAKTAHLQMQAFFEMPHQDVIAGFQVLKT